MNPETPVAKTTRLGELPPLFFGRSMRVAFGLASVGAAFVFGVETLTVGGFAGLLVLGLSFLVGGLIGNPGCELSAIPNLLIPRSKQFHFS